MLVQKEFSSRNFSTKKLSKKIEFKTNMDQKLFLVNQNLGKKYIFRTKKTLLGPKSVIFVFYE